MRKNINIVESSSLPPSKFWYRPSDDTIIEVNEHSTDIFDLWREMELPENTIDEYREHVASYEDEEDQRDALDAVEGDLLDLAFAHGWVRGGFDNDLNLHGINKKELRQAVQYFCELYPEYSNRIVLELNGVWQGYIEGQEVTRFIKSGRLPV